MNTHEQPSEPPVRPIDRFLAYFAITMVVLAIVCFIAVIIGTTVGADMGTPIWGVVSLMVMYGLPLGVVAFFVLLIMNMVRRSRATAAAGSRRKS